MIVLVDFVSGWREDGHLIREISSPKEGKYIAIERIVPLWIYPFSESKQGDSMSSVREPTSSYRVPTNDS